VILNHVTKILMRQHAGIEPMGDRDRIDKFQGLLYSISIHRVWVVICSGIWRDVHPFLTPGIRPSVETFKAIHHLGLLSSTEEDAYQALSLFDDIFPASCHTALTMYMIKRCHARGYQAGMTYQQFHTLNCFRETYTAPDHGVAPNMGFGNGGLRRLDYEYIDINLTVHGSATESVFFTIADTIQQNVPHVSTEEFRYTLSQLKKTSFQFKRWITNNQTGLTELEAEPLGSGKVIEIASSTEGGSLRLFVLRSWIDPEISSGI